MSFIVENWYIIVAAIAIVAVGVAAAVRFLKQPSDEQLDKVREWLLYATTLAEKELGGGTGKLKLRYVYGLFVDKFTWVAKVISFETFSELVDEALGQMNKLLTSNTAVQLYVNGPAEVEDDTAEG
jgi:hypothetical protein